MRRAEWRLAPQFADRALAGRRGDDGRREGRGIVERWQERRDRPREQGLARARWSDQEQAVSAGQGDLQTTPRLALTADLAEVRGRSAFGADHPRCRRRRHSTIRFDQLDAGRGCRGRAPRASGADDLDRIGAASRRRSRAGHRPAGPRRRRPARRRHAGGHGATGPRPSAARPARCGLRRRATVHRSGRPGPGRRGPARTRAGSRPPSPDRATHPPCAGQPGRD